MSIMIAAPAEIADAIETGLREAARNADREQAVAGIDALDELALHPLLAAGLTVAGFAVFREVRYPSERTKRNRTEGDRCDLVLTPAGRTLSAPDRESTLFDPPNPLPLSEAFWLEVKAVAQHTPEGPHPRYATTLLTALRIDAPKLAADPMILHAAVALLLFGETEAIVRHDLDIALDQGLSRNLPLASMNVRTLPITDRLGNTVCGVAFIPISHLGGG